MDNSINAKSSTIIPSLPHRNYLMPADVITCGRAAKLYFFHHIYPTRYVFHIFQYSGSRSELLLSQTTPVIIISIEQCIHHTPTYTRNLRLSLQAILAYINKTTCKHVKIHFYVQGNKLAALLAKQLKATCNKNKIHFLYDSQRPQNDLPTTHR